MKQKSGPIALLIVFTMFCSLLTGCGAAKTPSAAVSETSEINEEGAVATGDGTPAGERTLLADGNTYSDGLPIVNEKVTFRIARGKNPLDSGTDTNEKPIMKLMEEATNIHIEWIDIPTGEGQKEQLSILLSTDMPDAFLGMVDPADIMKDYASFVPLNDMLEKYAPNIKETYDKTNGEALKMLTYPDGNIYSFMSSVYTQHKSWTIGVQFINKDWLDRVGKDIPANLSGIL